MKRCGCVAAWQSDGDDTGSSSEGEGEGKEEEAGEPPADIPDSKEEEGKAKGKDQVGVRVGRWACLPGAAGAP